MESILDKENFRCMTEGEILFYCDSGVCFFRTVDGILSKLKEQDVWVSELPLKKKQFTKQQTFDIMDCNKLEYKEFAQISGNFCAFKNSDFSKMFVDEWLHYCCDIRAFAPPMVQTLEDQFLTGLPYYYYLWTPTIFVLLSLTNYKYKNNGIG